MYLEYWNATKIEQLTSQEKSNWFDVYNASLLEDRGYSLDKLNEEELEIAKAKIKSDYYEYLESLPKDSNFQFYTLLLDDSQNILSQCRLVKRNNVAYIAGLETHRNYRHKGYAKEVLQATIKKAFEQGNKSIHSVVRKWNEASIQTHKSLGFSISENKGDNLVLSLNNVNLIIIPIFEEFLDSKLASCKLISQRIDINDIRFNFEIITNSTKYVGKLHSNSFTKVSRIYQTNKLINIYNNTGYPTPKYIESQRYGLAHNYNVFGRNYCLWVEEFKGNLTVSEVLKKNPDAVKKIEELKITQIPKYIGEIASHTKNLKYNTNGPYRLFQNFDNISPIDKYEEYLNKVYNLLKNDININLNVLKKVYNSFFTIRKRLVKKYNDLPYAVFQSDLQDDNVLIDEEFNLVGVIDFNLAGREKVLTYLINELAYQELKTIKGLWVEESYIDYYINVFKDQLVTFKKYYTFNSLEKELFTDLYKVIIPFKYFPLTEIIDFFKTRDYDEVNYRIKWMEKILDLDLKLI